MKLLFIQCCLLVAWGTSTAFGQPSAPRASRLTYTVKLTFQAYGLPFQNLDDSFRNLGAGLGVDYGYNRSGSILQSVTVGYQGHTEHAQSFYLHTQFSYRPLLFQRVEPTVALGIGRQFSYSNPKNPYYEITDGSWRKSRKQSQGHWIVPLSISCGYRIKSSGKTSITPFVAYEVTPIIQYNSAFSVLPYSLLSAGTRIKFTQSSQ